MNDIKTEKKKNGKPNRRTNYMHGLEFIAVVRRRLQSETKTVLMQTWKTDICILLVWKRNAVRKNGNENEMKLADADICF